VSTATLAHEGWPEISDRARAVFDDPSRCLACRAHDARAGHRRVRVKPAQKRGGGLLTPLDTFSGEQMAQPESPQSIDDALEPGAGADRRAEVLLRLHAGRDRVEARRVLDDGPAPAGEDRRPGHATRGAFRVPIPIKEAAVRSGRSPSFGSPRCLDIWFSALFRKVCGFR
jgi:hypothetical protein